MMKTPKMFIDSGAFSLYQEHSKQKGGMRAYFKSKAFREYARNYAAFIKENERYIDVYSSIDVLYDPELSWENLKYLEGEFGLKPCPVVHYGTDLKWIDKHLSAGYDPIALGGMAVKIRGAKKSVLSWLNAVFERICPPPKRLPIVRAHGFGITAHAVLVRFPWWSVDSTSWSATASHGGILVPRGRPGAYDYLRKPWVVSVAWAGEILKKSRVAEVYRAILDAGTLPEDELRQAVGKDDGHIKKLKAKGHLVEKSGGLGLTGAGRVYITDRVKKFYSTQQNRKLSAVKRKPLTGHEWRIVQRWIDSIGVPLGEAKDNGAKGIVNLHRYRKLVNVIYYQNLVNALPDYPWAYTPQQEVSIGSML
jgi:hypothetical protein